MGLEALGMGLRGLGETKGDWEYQEWGYGALGPLGVG